MKLEASFPALAHPVDLGREPEGPGEQFDLRRFVQFVWRNKWIGAGGALAGAVLAMVYVASRDPTYTSTATVLFTPDQARAIDLGTTYTAAVRNGRSDPMVDQIQVLRSTNLMTKVVEDLHLDQTPAFNQALRPERIGWTTVEQWLSWRNLVPWGMLRDVGLIGIKQAAADAPSADQRAILAARDGLLHDTEVRALPDSSVIAISSTTSNPALSARIANAIANEYITSRIDSKVSATKDATEWLTDRVAELRSALETSEAAVADYDAQLAQSAGPSGTILKQQLEALSTAYSDAVGKRIAAEFRYEQATSALQNPDQIAVVPAFQDSSVIQNFRVNELKLKSDRAALARSVGSDDAGLKSIDQKIDDVRQNIRDEATRITAVLKYEDDLAKREESSSASRVHNLEEQIKELDRGELKLRQLEREANANRQIYEEFLGRLKSATQETKLQAPDATVLSPAEVPGGADSGLGKLALGMGAVLGGCLGFGAAFARDKLNNTFRGVEELEKASGFTVLGTVPSIGAKVERQAMVESMVESPLSPLAESIRKLRTSLRLSRVDNPPSVIMVTSSVQGEGKSTTALLLAIASARIGKRTILVEADLRRSALVDFGIVENRQSAGLSELLQGELPLEDAIVQDNRTGVYVLPGFFHERQGVNAADVLSSARFRSVMAELRSKFDLVIVDTSPVLPVSDARIISSTVDAAVYCVRWDHTPRDVVLAGLRDLAIVGTEMSGLVLTRVNVPRAASYGYYAAGYYEGYYRSASRAGLPDASRPDTAEKVTEA